MTSGRKNLPVCVLLTVVLLVAIAFFLLKSSHDLGGRNQNHEQRSWPDLAADWIERGDRGSRAVDESLLAGLGVLAKNHILLLAPPRVALAERTGAVSFL